MLGRFNLLVVYLSYKASIASANAVANVDSHNFVDVLKTAFENFISIF